MRIGDKIYFKPDLELGEMYGEFEYLGGMKQFRYGVHMVKSVQEDEKSFTIECSPYYFSPEMAMLVGLALDVQPPQPECMMYFNELTPEQKEHMDSDSQALFQVGVIDATLRVHPAGKILEYLLRLNYTGLADLAKKDIAAEKAKQAKQK